MFLLQTKAHPSLSKMADATKQHAKIDQSLAESLLDNQVQLKSNWLDMESILIFCTIGMTALLSVITLCSSIFLQDAGMVRALPTEQPSFEYKTKNLSHFRNNLTSVYLSFAITSPHGNMLISE